MTVASRCLGGLVRGYQLLVSPVLAPSCRFHPTCSRYALQAVDRFGVWRGGWLAVKRFARCHPWGECGNDPVPPTHPVREMTERRR